VRYERETVTAGARILFLNEAKGQIRKTSKDIREAELETSAQTQISSNPNKDEIVF
jgi:hypothetical protein